jgi:hypothetical protein
VAKKKGMLNDDGKQEDFVAIEEEEIRTLRLKK